MQKKQEELEEKPKKRRKKKEEEPFRILSVCSGSPATDTGNYSSGSFSVDICAENRG